MCRFCKLCSDAAKPVRTLCQTESTLHCNSVRIVTVFGFLIDHSILLRSPQGRTAQADSVFFAVPEVYAVPVDLIGKHPFRVSRGELTFRPTADLPRFKI